MFCEIIKRAVANNKSAVMVVRGRKLVDQASKRLDAERVDHGVMMAGHWRYRPRCSVQVCSIDTLTSREKYPNADLIIIDEAHMATSRGYKNFLDQEKYKNSFIIGCTATPYTPGGLGHLSDYVVEPITMKELISQNYLCDFKYIAPDIPSLKNVGINRSSQDFVNKELEEAMSGADLIGSIIKHYKKFSLDRKTLLFAVNINHSRYLVDKFNRSGVPSMHIDASSNDEVRREAIKALENGEIKVLSNVGILNTGVDIPCVDSIILARPTRSLNLFIQMCGRGTRIFKNKKDCLILDHGGNLARHSLPTLKRKAILDPKEKREIVRQPKRCVTCFAVFFSANCPNCEKPMPNSVEELVENDKALVVIDESTEIKMALNAYKREFKSSGKTPSGAYVKLISDYGYKKCKELGLLPQKITKLYEKPFIKSKRKIVPF